MIAKTWRYIFLGGSNNIYGRYGGKKYIHHHHQSAKSYILGVDVDDMLQIVAKSAKKYLRSSAAMQQKEE